MLTALLAVLRGLIQATARLQEALESRAIGNDIILRSVADLLQSLIAGTFVSTALYALWAFFEGVLVRRQAAWNYFRSSIQDESIESSPRR